MTITDSIDFLKAFLTGMISEDFPMNKIFARKRKEDKNEK